VKALRVGNTLPSYPQAPHGRDVDMKIKNSPGTKVVVLVRERHAEALHACEDEFWRGFEVRN